MLKRFASRLLRRATGTPAAGVLPKKAFRRFLPENPVIVEAGAHIGADTVEMARLWPGGVIHAFEPIPAIYRQLQERTRSCRNVFTHPQAGVDLKLSSAAEFLA